MDIKIEAPNHKNQDQLVDYYTKKLNAKYGQYPFVKAIDVKVLQEKNGQYNVALQCKPEKGNMFFVSDTAPNENKAFQEAIRKMNVHIEKYKEVHYKSMRRGSKDMLSSEE